MKPTHPRLVRLAEQWPTTKGTATDAAGRQYACERCTACECAIVPATLEARLSHLMTHHGWRMDGRRYDNQNHLLEVL